MLDGLKRAGLVIGGFSLCLVIQETLAGDTTAEGDFIAELEAIKTGDKRNQSVSYLKWENVKSVDKVSNDDKVRQAVKRIPKNDTAERLAQQMAESYTILKEHLQRDITLKRYMKELRERAKTSDTEALVMCDWAENYTLKVNLFLCA